MAIPKTMRAAVVEKFREPLVIRELPVPTPGPGQALVEIIASGVCHTDLHAADGDWPVKPDLPVTPGHEGAGIVVALDPGVTHLKEGDPVGIAWLHSACGHCDFCLAGWETLCLEQKNSGYSVNGSFAQYALAQADYVGRIPKNLPFVDAAPILCAGVTTYKGLKETNTRSGDWVVISGAGGGLGHVAIQYAKAMGLHVAAVAWGRKSRHWHESSEPRLRSMPGHKIRPQKFRNKLAGHMRRRGARTRREAGLVAVLVLAIISAVLGDWPWYEASRRQGLALHWPPRTRPWRP